MPLQFQTYKQTDERWKKMVMAPSRQTLGGAGCLVTAIVNALPNYAIDKMQPDGDVTPAELCQAVIAQGGFDAAGNLTPKVLEKIFPSVSFYAREFTTNYQGREIALKVNAEVAIARILNFLDIGQLPIIHVDACLNDKWPDHFVTLVRRDWTIVDSWDGQVINFRQRYGDPMTGVYGYLVFAAPPIGFDVDGKPAQGTVVGKLAQARRGINVTLNVREALDSIMSP